VCSLARSVWVPVCGEGESIADGVPTNTATVTCLPLGGAATVPIEITLAAQPQGEIGGETDFDVQMQFTLTEETVAMLGGFGVGVAEIGDSSADVTDGQSDPVNVAASVPCGVDFTADPDDNGTPGPIVVTTPVEAAAWTDVDGSIVLEALDMTFDIVTPVPLQMSTKDKANGDPGDCSWNNDVVPTLSFPIQ